MKLVSVLLREEYLKGLNELVRLAFVQVEAWLFERIGNMIMMELWDRREG